MESNGEESRIKIREVLHDKRIKTGVMLIALLLFSCSSGYVLATFFMSNETIPERAIQGSFTMTLNVNNVEDLYDWQIVVTFNPEEIKVLEVIPGGFLGSEFPFFLNASDVAEGTLLLGGLTLGETSGRSGNGTLALIVFGYYIDDYEEPRWVEYTTVNNWLLLETFLRNSKGSLISIEGSMLTLSVINK